LKDISIIGTGNVSECLIRHLLKFNINIQGVYGRNEGTLNALTKKYRTLSLTDIQDATKSDLVIIAVSDSQIEAVANQLPVFDGIVVHTSGITPIQVLNKHLKYGVFYPLQTMNREVETTMQDMPVLVEASDEVTNIDLYEFANQISFNAIKLNTEQRQYIHLAAVFANNFSNHIFKIAQEILQNNNINPSILNSLILETANNAINASALRSQTGPACRKDYKTITQHIKLLANHTNFAEIYQLITQSIINTYSTNKER
jgi:predicted short-subunit dehydrogenase-like oxidoreductase (DUF2520 family)